MNQMKSVTKFYYHVDEADLDVECPWYAEQVVHEILIPERCVILGVLAVDYDEPNPREEFPDSCTETMDQQWLNDEVFGYGVWVYDVRGNLITRDDECWGLYGEDYALSELKDAFDRVAKSYKK